MKIQEPIRIKNVTLKNRIGLPSLLNMPGGDDSSVNDLTVRWFESRARGGAGLIMTGTVASTAPDPRIVARVRITRGAGIALYDDRFIPGFARLAQALHYHGAKLGVQMGIIGSVMGGRGPSAPPYPDELNATDDLFLVMNGVRIPWTEVTIEQIERSQNDIAAAAARAKAAGADVVELHCAHGGATGGCSFISPYYNHRTDRYGGSWENRLRHPVETIQKIRKAVGDDFPVFVRLSTDQLLGSRGITIEDTCKIIVPALEKAGVDAIDCSQGDMIRAGQGITIPLYYPRGCFIDFPAAVKKVTKLPVIGVGRIVDMEMANRFIEEGNADIVFMGRQLVADPETPKKYFEGRRDEIRTCIGCLAGCGSPCPINYDIQDQPIPLTRAEKKKNVLVIGGGVGGMEAARIATLRGHSVILIEKDTQLGGMVGALALTKLTSEFGNIVDYLGAEMRRLKVDVRVCQEASPENIAAFKPDVIILATGSSMIIPEVARGKSGVMHHIEALRKKNAIGKRVAIWGLVAAELAVSLAEEGKDVVLFGRGGAETLARDYPQAQRFYLLRKLTDINVPRATPEAQRVTNPRVMFYVDVTNITCEGITLVSKDGEKSVLPYDTLIISRERQANDSLFSQLQGKAAEVYKIGDCDKVGDIQTAIWGANEIARKI